MSDLTKAKEAVKAAGERGKSKRTEYRKKQQEAQRRSNFQSIWSPQYGADGRPGPQVALVTCPIEEILFGGARGGGKALPLDEVVLTPSGYRPMGSLKVGDQVCGPEYIPTMVVGVYPQGVERVYQVTLIDGRTVRASAGHLWRCRIGNDDEFVVTTDYIRTLLDEVVEVSIPVVSLDLWVPISRITDAGLTETQCIKVARDDGLFMTADEIVTHNTDGALGCWLIHANTYGQHAKGVFFRRRFKQLEEVQNRCSMLFPKLGATFIKGEATWVFPNGATLKLRHLWDEQSCEEYQGHAYCVAAGTPVLMGDGSYQPIENIQIGDLVMTLEGPKPVTWTMEPRVSQCVRVDVFDAEGVKLGEQIHPADHPVLTTVSPRTQGRRATAPGSSPPLGSHAPEPVSEPHPSADPDFASHGIASDQERPTVQASDTLSFGSFQTDPQRRQYPAQWQSYTTLLDAHRESLESSVCPEDGQSGYTWFEGSPQETQPLPALSVRVALHAPDLLTHRPGSLASSLSPAFGRSSGLSAPISPGHTGGPLDLLRPDELARSLQGRSRLRPEGGDGACGQLGSQIVEGYQDHCLPGSHPCDGQPLPASETCQASLPLPDGAGTRTRPAERMDGLEHTGGHKSLQSEARYVHPYTGEHRTVRQPYQFGTAVFQPCEPHVVHDLCVADSNHYITKSQLVNCNTFMVFEELTNWPTPGPMNKMRATLRNAHKVPSKIICTANPGGSGHNWVKARYITPAPKGFFPITDLESGEVRVFIPSKLEDNRALFENDPNYERRLLQSGNAALVKAWRHGDWDVVAGGALDDLWNPDKHLLRPFAIPHGWRYRRSFDWGSAAPASLGIWAISDGTPVQEMDGFVFPRGSIVRIDEWYTVAHDAAGNIRPNEGLRLTNLALGAGIAHRAQGRNFSGCVADPAIFSQHGRQSIFSEMQLGARENGHHLLFNMADNNRVAGWQKVRDMLENAAADNPEKPGLYAFETCVHYARTVPVAQRDEDKPDDIDTDQEDHVLDDVRYMAMTGGRGVVEGSITGH